MNSELTVSAARIVEKKKREDGGSRHAHEHTFGFRFFLFVQRARPINVFVGEVALHIAAVNEHRM